MPSAMPDVIPGQVLNFIDHAWEAASGGDFVDVVNPATAERIGRTPLSTAADVARAAEAAARALPGWRQTPATERVQYLFKLKALLEEDLEGLARLITLECGKTLEEARGEMRRAIENVEIACGMPILMQG